ncbi:MAG: flagellin, partial [Huintestinicola sp.]
GTGYLACMYLGYVAAGSDADMNDSVGAAADIASGVSLILSKLVNGNSLDSVIKEVTGQKYANTAAFANGFANDTDALNFVKQLLKYTSDDPNNDGNVGGGLLSGDLAKTDPVANGNISGLKLFALNTSNTIVKNQYPAEVTILSGGTKSASGIAPTTSVTPPPAIVYPAGLFTVKGGTEGVDWKYDTSTGTLKILTGKNLEISGGTLTDANGTFYGNIVIADNTDANITLSGVDIDTSKKSGDNAGILIGNNSTSTINIKGTNNISGGGKCAGIQLSDNNSADGESTVIINSESGSTLNVNGGTYGAGIGAAQSSNASASNIQINGSGTINASSGKGSAAIGGGYNSNFGDISINGSGITIKAEAAAHGAGIGGGWVANVGNITILGKANITATGIEHGTGIGGGCQGDVGIITIGDSSTGDNDIVISTKGGNDGAAIGSSWNGDVKNIIINGGTITADAGKNGAGIGSGLNGNSGTITINGGVISAKGSTDASGIGGGKSGTVSGIVINGGEITADGGWTYDGGNIGGYSDSSGKNKATVTINDPNGLSIKAGSGEGKYITTGAKDSGGNTLYALDISYLDSLLSGGKIALTDNGADASSLSYPIDISVVTKDGTTYSWSDLQHSSENSAYIWMKAQDLSLTFTDADGTKGSVDLKFFDNYGMWRINKTDLPPDPPKEPGYNNPVNPADPPADPDDDSTDNIWIMQTGPRSKDTFFMNIGRMNTTVLGVDKATVNIKTQIEANKTIDIVDKATAKVSLQRANLGAYQNRLEHKFDNLNVSHNNLQASESQIRDADLSEFMTKFTKEQIVNNAAQAMLAQAMSISQGVLSLLN